MGIFSGATPSDRKKMICLLIWLLGGAGMVIAGLLALFNSEKTIDAVSGFLGVCALLTGTVTLFVRISMAKRIGKHGIGLDVVLWLALGILLLNTGLLRRLGKLAFVICGAVMVCEGVRAFIAARRSRDEKNLLVPRSVFSAVLSVMGVIVIINAEKIFRSMIVLAVGIYFIIHGTQIIYEWIGAAKHFRNFRGTE